MENFHFFLNRILTESSQKTSNIEYTKELKLQILSLLPPPPTFTESEEISEKIDESTDTIESEEKEIPKNEWVGMVMRNHQDILYLRERTRGLLKLKTFGSLMRKEFTESRSTIPQNEILQTIMDFLSKNEYKRALNSLQEESEINFVKPIHEGQLESLLSLELHDINNVWELEPPKPIADFERIVPVDEFYYEDDSDYEETEDEEIINRIQDLLEFKTGTITKLLEHLISTTDPNYRTIFLLTYQSFMTPWRFLRILRNKFNKQSATALTEIILSWVINHFDDFSDRLLYELQEFIDKDIMLYYPDSARTLRAAISKHIHSRKIILTKAPPPPIVPKTIFSPNLELSSISEEEIARQFTLIHYNIFDQIRIPELLECNWIIKPHLSEHVNKLIEITDMLQGWVSSEIVTTKKLRERSRMVTRFVRLAHNLKQLKNFNGAMAVIKGLSVAPVKRLRHTFDDISRRDKQTLSTLNLLFSPDDGYASYRFELHTRARPPCIPCLNIHLNDIESLQDTSLFITNQDKTLINFEKCSLVHGVLLELRSFQNHKYNYYPVEQIEKFLHDLHVVGSDALYGHSLLVEPREIAKSQLN